MEDQRRNELEKFIGPGNGGPGRSKRALLPGMLSGWQAAAERFCGRYGMLAACFRFAV